MEAVSKELYETPVEERVKKIPDQIILAESLHYFHLSFPRNSVMLPPEFSEYSSLSKDMPALTLFVHRAMGMMQEINERIESRNARIVECARENETNAGMTADRIIYYSSMLSTEGKAICEHTDFALDFWRLVLDQIKAYKMAKCVGEHVIDYELIPKAIEEMPKEDLFPMMRMQLATFTNKDT